MSVLGVITGKAFEATGASLKRDFGTEIIVTSICGKLYVNNLHLGLSNAIYTYPPRSGWRYTPNVNARISRVWGALSCVSKLTAFYLLRDILCQIFQILAIIANANYSREALGKCHHIGRE